MSDLNSQYTQQSNKSVLDQVTSGIGNLVNSAGNLASQLANDLSSAGTALGSIGDLLASELDTLISGADSFFTSASPSRIPVNALSNRNKSADSTANPETKISSSQNTVSPGAPNSFPLDLPPYYMKLQFCKYERPSPFGNTALNNIEAVILPVPDGAGLVDNTTANWEDTSTGIVGNAYDSSKYSDATKTGQATDAAIAAGAKLLSGVSPETVGLAESIVGAVPNPGMSVLFKGMSFRSFVFSWTFAPKNEQETQALREIINIIKRNHLPTFSGSGSSYIFNYPSVVLPSIYPDDAQNNMTDFQYCALKSVNVSFSPQGVAPAFYSTTKAPVFVSLTLELEEIEYRLPDKYGGNLFGSGVTNTAIQSAQAQITQAQKTVT
jgi:hypothetical protein